MLATIAVGVPWTLAVTAVSFAIGAMLGIPLCALRLSHLSIFRAAAGVIVLTFRCIPPIVWLFLIYFGIGSGYFNVGAFQAATIGLGLITAANMSEIYRGSLNAVHRGQWEAAAALNLPARSRFLDVVGPQVLRVSLPSAVTYAIGLLKDSAIASTIGIVELSFQAYLLTQKTHRGLEVYAIAGLLYILISLPMAVVARRADEHLRAKVAR